MKLTIERAALLKSLGHVQSVVERRNTIPILAHVLIEAEEQTLSLTATDMDLTMVETAPSDVANAGSATAPAHTFHEIVRKLPDGSQVAIERDEDGGRLLIRAGRSRFTLPCLPAEDFPALAGGDLPHAFRLPAKDLRELIDRTRFAISTEETRYYLNGIYVHATDGADDGDRVLRAVATDGHRLARFEMAAPEGAGDIPGIIVPRKTVNELRKLLDGSDQEVQASLSDVSVRFAFDNVVLTSKLIDGTFPDYERVIPSANDKIMEVDRKTFAAAVDRVATISTDRSRAVKIALDAGSITVSASSPENGSASEEVEAAYDSDAIEIGFNARYLLDITDRISGDYCQFVLADGASPTLVRDVGTPGALYVLMPMRV